MRSMILVVGLSGCIDTELAAVRVPEAEGVRELLVDPGVVDFGVLASNAPVTDVVTLTSVGNLPVRVSTIDLSGSSAYSITWPSSDLVLESGESADVVVTYTPTSFDDLGSMVVRSNANEPNQAVVLHGAGKYPAIAINPSSVSFVSEYGEAMYTDVVVSSIGTADLDISSMIVDGARFTAEGDIPELLPPGDTTTISVKYSPEVEGEIATGKIWLTTNTELGYAVVPLEGRQGTPCIGLGEAWDRGLLDAYTTSSGSSLRVDNLSLVEEVCIDNWYVWLSTESQDMGAGDMDADFGDVFPRGSLGIQPNKSITFQAAVQSGPSWWCVEHTQYTQPNAEYEFLGARVPEPLLTFMLAEDQDSVWAWQEENAVMIAARRTNFVSMPGGGDTTPVTLRVLNMGGRLGRAEVHETVLAGYSASEFSQSPSRVEDGADGATVYVFDVVLGARTLTSQYVQTGYEEHEITYTLTVPECRGRQYHPAMETHWVDSDQVDRVATANPLVIGCEESLD